MAKPDIAVHSNQLARWNVLHGVRIREDVAFTNYKGEEDGKARKRVSKILENLAPILQRMLQHDEVVLFAARLQAPVATLERLTNNWYTYRMSAVMLVFTNSRIIHLLVDTSGKWKGSIRVVAVGDMLEATTKGWLSRNLLLKYRSTKTDKYWRVRRGDSNKIRLIADTLLPASTGESTAVQGMVSLCPECLASLKERLYVCGNCGLVFRDEITLTKRALWIPGGGYFYTGYTLLGVVSLLTEGWMIFAILVTAAAAYRSWGTKPLKPGAATATDFLIAAVFFAFLLAVEKTVMILHCRRLVRNYMSTGQKDLSRIGIIAATAGRGWD